MRRGHGRRRCPKRPRLSTLGTSCGRRWLGGATEAEIVVADQADVRCGCGMLLTVRWAQGGLRVAMGRHTTPHSEVKFGRQDFAPEIHCLGCGRDVTDKALKALGAGGPDRGHDVTD